VIDRRWRDHLYEMDYLKDGIGLRAMAQRDPLVEYQREGFAMFQQMMGQIREETVGFLFNLDVEVTAGTGEVDGPSVAAKGLAPADAPEEKLSYTAPSDSGGVEVRNQRGQIQQAATDRARRSTPVAANDDEPAAAAGPAQRGAFGQKAQGDAPVNRAERRAAGKKTT
jgi:preprotein translocase subunit SecA